VPAEVGLAVEISLTTFDQDRGKKLLAYASGGIAVYSMINLAERQVEIYTNPAPGGYLSRADFKPGQDLPLIIDGQALEPIAVIDVLRSSPASTCGEPLAIPRGTSVDPRSARDPRHHRNAGVVTQTSAANSRSRGPRLRNRAGMAHNNEGEWLGGRGIGSLRKCERAKVRSAKVRGADRPPAERGKRENSRYAPAHIKPKLRTELFSR
jgi:hypothetical protein